MWTVKISPILSSIVVYKVKTKVILNLNRGRFLSLEFLDA